MHDQLLNTIGGDLGSISLICFFQPIVWFPGVPVSPERAQLERDDLKLEAEEEHQEPTLPVSAKPDNYLLELTLHISINIARVINF